MSAWQEARNIVAMRLDNMGDVVMLGPALRAIKEASPEARLTLLASRAGAQVAPLLPWIDDVMIWRPVWQDVGQQIPFDPERERQTIADLAARKFDAALIFSSFSQTPHVAGYVAYLAGIPLRAGESMEFGGSTLTSELQGAPFEMHQAERNLRLVEGLGFPVDERQMEIQIPDDAKASARALLQWHGLADGDPFIIFHPSATASARSIPTDICPGIAAGLVELGYSVFLTGASKEADYLESIAERAGERVHSIAGLTSLAEFAALIEQAALMVCGNTLPLHLADALNTPVVALYSGSDLEEQWRPLYTRSRVLRRPTACYPCYRFDCPIGQLCLNLPVDEVIESARALLGHRNGIAERLVG